MKITARSFALMGVSIIALATLPAAAQVTGASQTTPPDISGDTTGAPAEQNAEAGQEPAAPITNQQEAREIVVTGSRVARKGFAAPTPTSIIGSASIDQRAQTNVTDVLNSLPSFRPSVTPATSGPSFRAGQSSPDLRGMGTVRTLLLVDGLRATPTSATGLSDLNLLPSLLVDHIEVVTGGASAGYGSDAVAGVVNVILKDQAEGIQIDFTKGISDYGDNAETRLGAIAGLQFGGGRGHLLIAGEYADNDGIGDYRSRAWASRKTALYTNASTTNGLPQRVILPNVYVSNLTTGGLITGVTGNASSVLLNQAFRADGTAYPFQFGSLSSGTQTVGANVGSNEGVTTSGDDLLLLIPVERYSAAVRASYDLSDNLTLFANGMIAGFETTSFTFPQRAFGATALTISGANPYLPPSMAAQIGTGTVSLSRQFADAGAPQTFSRSRTYNGVIGMKGSLGGTWKWDVAAQYGHSDFTQTSPGQILTARLTRAVDAVRNTGGQIVCRVNADAVTTNDDPACAPFNPFGTGAPSAAALDYVSATAMLNVVTTQEQYVANLRGEPFSTWAGPVSFAVGGEYRRVDAEQTVDENSRQNAYLNPPSNQKPLSGSYNVKEAYAETVVPLLRDAPLAYSLDLNGAVRVTDYSTSGTVTTWKVGASYKPVDGLLLRATRSRDIRAPNIAELFTDSQVTSPNNLINPFRGNAPAGLVTVVTSGNRDLKPEVAKTWTAGAVLQPHFAPGLSLSVDYYDIKLGGAIAALTTQVILNQCAGGNQALCPLVSLDASNNILQIRNQSINIASYRFSGVDVELDYRLPLSELSSAAGGALNFNVNVNRAINAAVNDGVSGTVNRAGDVGSTVSGGIGIGGPKWRGTFSLLYSNENFSLGTQVRYIGPAKFDNTYAEGVGGTPQPGGFTISENDVPSVTYVDLNASVTVLKGAGSKLRLTAAVNNLFDRDPPVVPLGGGATNTAIYDTIGRTYKIGARLSF